MVPVTDHDPLPYAPAPRAEGSTDEPVALVAAGGEDQARWMLHDLLMAMRDGDERRLEQLLADELLSPYPGEGGRLRPRAAVIPQILTVSRRGLIQPDVQIGALVELDRVEVSRAARFFEHRSLPAGLRATDIVVVVPMRDEGRTPMRMMLGPHWQLRGHLVIRPGQDARVVAL